MKAGDTCQLAAHYPLAIFVEFAQFCRKSRELRQDFWIYDMVKYPKIYWIGHIEYERDSFKMPVLELP